MRVVDAAFTHLEIRSVAQRFRTGAQSVRLATEKAVNWPAPHSTCDTVALRTSSLCTDQSTGRHGLDALVSFAVVDGATLADATRKHMLPLGIGAQRPPSIIVIDAKQKGLTRLRCIAG